MRADLKDVIIDIGRWGKHDPPKKTQPTNDVDELEKLPEYEGSKKRYSEGGWGWHFGDRLSPLDRALRKNVGRPWNKVYSELVASADSRNIRGWHLRDHIDSMVLSLNEYKVLKERRWYRSRGLFYVDERGILRQENEYRKHQWNRPKDPDNCTIGDRRFTRVNNCWFEAWYEEKDVAEQFWNYITQKRETRYNKEEYIARKRQLGKKELKALGLSNEPGFEWWKK